MKAKTMVCWLLLAALMLLFVPTAALADGTYGGLTVTGGAENTDYSYVGNSLTILTGTPLTLSGSTSTTKVIINTNVTANLTLQDASIDARSLGAAIHLYGGTTLNLTVLGNNTLWSGTDLGGIDVTSGTTLVITQASTGTLNVTGGNDGAGIGGSNRASCGNVTIWNGTINAAGSHDGAGIGGGKDGAGGTIVIRGGTVRATGGSAASGYTGAGAGIGGGSWGHGGNINISGGYVEAKSNFWAAGIGGGWRGDGGTIAISGGTVKATGNSGGAGIGGGSSGAGGNITISGDTVQAVSGGGGAGIGGGWSGNGGTIRVVGGVVFANSIAGPKDVGAGSPYEDPVPTDGSLEISGTAALFLKNDTCSTPITSTHKHINVTGHTAGVSVYGYPVAWDGNFGSYLFLYSLAYELNGGEAIPANPPYYGPQCNSFALTNPTKTGYTFTGWTGTDITGLSLSVTILPSFTGNRTYIANWTPNTYDEAEAVPTPQGTIVNCTRGVNVRSGPGTKFSILGVAPKGATYTITGQSGAWYKVNLGGIEGYISARYLLVAAQALNPASPTAEQGTVVNCNHSVNIRSGPGTRYSILGFAPKGSIYTIIERTGAWYKIEFNGNTAYILARYFSVGDA